MLEAKLCETCGWGMFGERKSKKYCSVACKQKAHRERNGQKKGNVSSTLVQQNDRLNCPHCGKGYWQSLTGRKRKFCSDSCRVSANRRLNGAIRNLLRKLQRRDYHMEQWVNAANEGSETFMQHALRYGFVYDAANGIFRERIELNTLTQTTWLTINA